MMIEGLTAVAEEILKQAAVKETGEATIAELGRQSVLDGIFPVLGHERLPDVFARFEHIDASMEALECARRPEVLTKAVAGRMWAEGLTPEAWARADEAGRARMMAEAKQIMGQEMFLSPQFRSSVHLVFDSVPGGELSETTALRADVDGGLEIHDPEIRLDPSLLASDDYTGAFSRLYHEMCHAMQMDSITQAEAFSENVPYWLRDYLENSTPDVRTSVAGNSMEAYASAQEAYFMKVFKGFETDILDDMQARIAGLYDAAEQTGMRYGQIMAGKDF